MNGITKEEQIKRYKAHNPEKEASEIATKLNTSPVYVWECWEPKLTADDVPPPPTGVDAGEHTDPSDDTGDGTDEQTIERATLTIEDNWGSCECDSCGSEVAYMDDKCGECRESLYWTHG